MTETEPSPAHNEIFDRALAQVSKARLTPALVETGTALAVIDGRNLPKPVLDGIVELLLAFPSRNIDPNDRTILLGTYKDAVAGFPQPVVEDVLKWLRFNNPRNTSSFTQPPTPQDVREAVEKRIEDNREKKPEELAARWDARQAERVRKERGW